MGLLAILLALAAGVGGYFATTGGLPKPAPDPLKRLDVGKAAPTSTATTPTTSKAAPTSTAAPTGKATPATPPTSSTPTTAAKAPAPKKSEKDKPDEKDAGPTVPDVQKLAREMVQHDAEVLAPVAIKEEQDRAQAEADAAREREANARAAEKAIEDAGTVTAGIGDDMFSTFTSALSKVPLWGVAAPFLSAGKKGIDEATGHRDPAEGPAPSAPPAEGPRGSSPDPRRPEGQARYRSPPDARTRGIIRRAHLHINEAKAQQQTAEAAEKAAEARAATAEAAEKTAEANAAEATRAIVLWNEHTPHFPWAKVPLPALVPSLPPPAAPPPAPAPPTGAPTAATPSAGQPTAAQGDKRHDPRVLRSHGEPAARAYQPLTAPPDRPARKRPEEPQGQPSRPGQEQRPKKHERPQAGQPPRRDEPQGRPRPDERDEPRPDERNDDEAPPADDNQSPEPMPEQATDFEDPGTSGTGDHMSTDPSREAQATLNETFQSMAGLDDAQGDLYHAMLSGLADEEMAGYHAEHRREIAAKDRLLQAERTHGAKSAQAIAARGAYQQAKVDLRGEAADRRRNRTAMHNARAGAVAQSNAMERKLKRDMSRAVAAGDKKVLDALNQQMDGLKALTQQAQTDNAAAAQLATGKIDDLTKTVQQIGAQVQQGQPPAAAVAAVVPQQPAPAVIEQLTSPQYVQATPGAIALPQAMMPAMVPAMMPEPMPQAQPFAMQPTTQPGGGAPLVINIEEGGGGGGGGGGKNGGDNSDDNSDDNNDNSDADVLSTLLDSLGTEGTDEDDMAGDDCDNGRCGTGGTGDDFDEDDDLAGYDDDEDD